MQSDQTLFLFSFYPDYSDEVSEDEEEEDDDDAEEDEDAGAKPNR